jgi:hypothetical protein
MFCEGRVYAAAALHFDLQKLVPAHARAFEADMNAEALSTRLRYLAGGPPHTLALPLAVARAREAGVARKVVRCALGEEGRPGVAAAHLVAWVELLTALAEMPGDGGEHLELIVPQDGGDMPGQRRALRRAWPHVLAALEARVARDGALCGCDIVLRNMAVSSASEEDEESDDSERALAGGSLEEDSEKRAEREAQMSEAVALWLQARTRQLRPRLDALVAAPRAAPCEVAVILYIMTCNFQFMIDAAAHCAAAL